MERIYEFEKSAYRNKVLLVNVLLAPILAYCLYRVLVVQTNTALWAMAAAVCVYGLANSFLRKSNPRIIKISDEKIVFSSFGEKSFEIARLTKFRVKVSTPNYQVLIRVEDSDKRQGAFWVTYSQFNDKLDLLAEFDYLEKKVHPGSLRFRGRDALGNARPPMPGSAPPQSAGKTEEGKKTEGGGETEG
jgi:hypothetical protein